MSRLADTRGSIPNYYGLILGAIALVAVVMSSEWGRAQWDALFRPDLAATLPSEGKPAIVNVILPPAGLPLEAGNKALFTVVYNRPVSVWGTPALPIDIGYRRRYAQFEYQPTPEQLRFSYVIGDGDRDSNGIMTGSALKLQDSGIGLIWLGLAHGGAVYLPAPIALPHQKENGPRVGVSE